MTQPRHWPLSQAANEQSGLCGHCRTTHQRHIKDGMVHRHGHRGNPCPGLHRSTLSICDQSGATAASGMSSSSGPSQPVLLEDGTGTDPGRVSIPRVLGLPLEGGGSLDGPHWSPVDLPIIKRIHRAPRRLCTLHLSHLYHRILDSPSVVHNWIELMSWCAPFVSTRAQARGAGGRTLRP
jgi:hypothetical protein